MKTFLAIVCSVLMALPAAAQTRKKSSESSTPAKTETSKSKTSEPEAEAPEATSSKSTTAKKKTSATKPTTTSEKKVSTTKASETVDKSTTKSGNPKSGSTKKGESTTNKKGGTADAAKEAESNKTPPIKAEGEQTSKKDGKADDAASTTEKAATPDPSTITKKSMKPPQDNAGDDPATTKRSVGPNVTLSPEDLTEFDTLSEPIQKLLRNGLTLTERNLTYRYGSSDPNSGGMDCSGTIYYLLKQTGIKEPPRDSSGLYLWAEKAGTLRSASVKDLEDRALFDLKPGDLLFWEGTYEVQRNPPISHTMIYLGREKKTGTRVMVGASDGRTYAGVSRNGVSVFDFRLPRTESSAKFVGYARVPGLDHSVRRNTEVNQ